MKKKVLITGISGYIGSNVARRLVHNKWSVCGIIRKHTKVDLLTDIAKDIDFTIYDGTVHSLLNCIKIYKPTAVFHLASCCLTKHRPDQINDLINANILFGVHLLEAMEKGGVRLLVNTSTVWQHYCNKDYSPVCLYAATKEAFEKIITFYVDAYNFNVITLELSDTYGPNDLRNKIIPLFCKISQTGAQLLMSPGEQELDLVYIDDIIRAYEIAYQLILSKANIYTKYTVTTQKPVKLKDIAKLFEDTFKTKLNIIWGGRSYKNREVMKVWNKGHVLPNWVPVYTLKSGLKKLRDKSIILSEKHKVIQK